MADRSGGGAGAELCGSGQPADTFADSLPLAALISVQMSRMAGKGEKPLLSCGVAAPHETISSRRKM